MKKGNAYRGPGKRYKGPPFPSSDIIILISSDTSTISRFNHRKQTQTEANMKTFNVLVLAVLGFATHGYAVSCQSQGGACHDGNRDCPAGTRSVFWDTGCNSAFWPWQDDDKCCIPA
ncbi:hypothetical protein BJX61DRAFT_545463 [Aspergillus egyptiacus]|nr:hypothetical protein BJX61DRAFT_545463 [Aspergillus egyptiacus]